MSASADFPRGWTASSIATAGNTASITIPAVAGIAHVLSGFSVKVESQNTTALFAYNIELAYGATVITLGRVVGSEASSSGEVVTDTSELQDVNIQAGVGLAMTITLGSPAGVSEVQTLIAQGYDI